MKYFLFLLFYFILSILICPISLTVSFIYPYSIPLKDEKILVIHKLGISIYNSRINSIENTTIVFSVNEQISTNERLSKITHVTENDYIFCIINDQIYIFSDEGELLSKYSSSIISSYETVEYYTLVPIPKTNSYYIVIGYIYNYYLNFKCYIYSFSDKSISFQFQRLQKPHYYEPNYSWETYYIENKGITCQFLKNNSKGDVLTCFFLIYTYDYFLTADLFKFSESGINFHEEFNPDHFYLGNIVNIKSVRSPDSTTAFVCMYLNNGKPMHLIYDININYEYGFDYFLWDNYQCKKLIHGLKVNYHEKNSEYSFSCFSENNGILVYLFDIEYLNYQIITKYSSTPQTISDNK